MQIVQSDAGQERELALVERRRELGGGRLQHRLRVRQVLLPAADPAGRRLADHAAAELPRERLGALAPAVGAVGRARAQAGDSHWPVHTGSRFSKKARDALLYVVGRERERELRVEELEHGPTRYLFLL